MRHRFLHIMRPALLMALSLALTGAVADVNSPLSLACPQAISVGNDLDQCSALVTYPDPGVTGGNGAVTVSCVPPSGSTPVQRYRITPATSAGPPSETTA